MLFAVPPEVGQNIARAQSLIKREEPVRALEALLRALSLFEPRNIVGRARSAAEISIYECLADFNAYPAIHNLIREIAHSDSAFIPYKPGEEAKLVAVLQLLRKAIAEAAAQKAAAVESSRVQLKEERFAKAEAAVKAKELPRARSIFHRITEEYGSEQGVLHRIAKILITSGLQPDAVEYLEAAQEAFPRDASIYADLVGCHLTLREYDKAEKIYLMVIKEFGRHPKTLVNLGKLYISWNKHAEAFEVINDARRLAPNDPDVKELWSRVETW